MKWLNSFSSQIKFTIILSGVGIIGSFVIMYFVMRSFFLNEEMIKAKNVVDNTLKIQEQIASLHQNDLKCAKVFKNIKSDAIIKEFTKKEDVSPLEYKALDMFYKTDKDHFFSEVEGKNMVFFAKRVIIKKSCLKCHGVPYKDISAKMYAKLKKYDGIFNYKKGDTIGAIGAYLPYDKNKLNNIFIGVVLFLSAGFVIGTLIFLRLTSQVERFIQKFLDYLKDISNNVYKPIKDDFKLEEFERLKDGFNEMIKKVKEYKGEIYKKLYYHPLSGLPNRIKYFDTIKKVKKPVIIFNIDKFKDINAYFGPEIGDKLIVEVARRLEAIKKDYGFKVFHISIDEFAILLGKTPSKDNLILILQDLFKELERAYVIDTNEIVIKFRVGVSYEEKKYIIAEIALDKAKDLKRDIVFGEDVVDSKKDYESNIKWYKKLREALDEDRIRPYYQPIVDRDGNIVKYEALVRLIDGDKAISPFFFLDISKRTRTYFEITKRVVDKAFEDFKDKPFGVSINLDLNDIENDKMRDYILEKVNTTKNVDVTFELVESEDIRESKFIANYLNILQKLGADIYIDDFGSGYSNFDYLIKLTPTGIKIDGSLIKTILDDKNDEMLVRTIVDFAKNVNIKVVAEFVENEAIFEKLKEIGVDYFQGYYFSPPIPEVKDKL
ncbi:MAG: EAL domain-containing protein [Epsilonproteobacteria bacterium]|nr:EAL domain-containing protein [Campylobacterota bacterium]